MSENREESLLQYEYIEKVNKIISKLSENKGSKLNACVTTFGCQMNAKDSEKLCGILEDCGFNIVDDEKAADFVIFNTCTVRDNANQKVYGHLGIMHHMKKSNKDLKIALCGCMMQEESVIDNLKKNYRYVDLIFGTHNIFKFAVIVRIRAAFFNSYHNFS